MNANRTGLYPIIRRARRPLIDVAAVAPVTTGAATAKNAPAFAPGAMAVNAASTGPIGGAGKNRQSCDNEKAAKANG